MGTTPSCSASLRMLSASKPPWSARATAVSSTRARFRRSRRGASTNGSLPLDRCTSYTYRRRGEGVHRTPLAGGDMNSPRVAGVLYFVTHVTSVAALVLYGPVLNNPDYVTGPGRDTQILVGGLLEVVLALAVVGTAVALYPTVARYSPAGALGYAALRAVEAATILAGVATLLGVVTLRQQYAGATATDTAALTVSGRALVAVHDWTFLVGPG